MSGQREAGSEKQEARNGKPEAGSRKLFVPQRLYRVQP
jgi:hypothetical protein